MEPPIAHMIPEGSGHLLLPQSALSLFLLTLDPRIALASLVTVPLSMIHTYHDNQWKKFH